ncbi:BrnA antitoxin family protein [Janthinobacterium psychrotolerans]|uniref:BrnA antitoxin family protein n=1 Tax=Janthinobacterium psychrotolerans TaxID=1747903 RepID=UPI0008067637|nr:BrnA antitoxin family protein [Janthinobacterium psychrotolerans]
MTETFFEQGRWEVVGKAVSGRQAQAELAVRRGRPAGSGNKVSTTIRFDTEILDAFKATG